MTVSMERKILVKVTRSQNMLRTFAMQVLIFAAMPATVVRILSNSYTMGCPPVRRDNPRALASGLSYVQVEKHGITIL